MKMPEKSYYVAHLNPDYESLKGLWLVTRHQDIADQLGLRGEIVAKFIPSGPLRHEDFSWVRDPEKNLNARYLKSKGYLFFDCGGGELDHHGMDSIGHGSSSIELIVCRVGIDKRHPELMPLLKVISENDKRGTDVAAKHDYRSSPTPNTPRHIRNMIAGWNLLYPDNPHMVAALALSAFDCVYAGILKDIEDGVERPANERTLYDNIFLLARRAGKEALAKEVAEHGEQALEAMEQEWLKAVKDYWNPDVCEGFTVRLASGQKLLLAAGKTSNRRFGQVTRLGNFGKRASWPNRKFRNKATVTLQWSGEGHFVLSSGGLVLDDVARELRLADFIKRYDRAPTEVEYAAMCCRGEYFLPDGKIGIYSPDYGTGVGNAFYSNPYAEATVLTYDEVVDTVLYVLRQ